MDENLVRKALTALEGLEHQRRDAIEILVRHLHNDAPHCEETVNRLLGVLDNRDAVAEVRRAEVARDALNAALSSAAERRSQAQPSILR